MADEAPITPEQALLAVKAAGMDPDKSVNAQLQGDLNGALERQLADLSEQVKTLTEALRVAGQPTDPQSHKRRLAEGYREALNRSLTSWIGDKHDDAP
jgi:hypothetical protein